MITSRTEYVESTRLVGGVGLWATVVAVTKIVMVMMTILIRRRRSRLLRVGLMMVMMMIMVLRRRANQIRNTSRSLARRAMGELR